MQETCNVTEEWCGLFIGRKYCSTHDQKWDGPRSACPGTLQQTGMVL